MRGVKTWGQLHVKESAGTEAGNGHDAGPLQVVSVRICDPRFLRCDYTTSAGAVQRGRRLQRQHCVHAR